MFAYKGYNAASEMLFPVCLGLLRSNSRSGQDSVTTPTPTPEHTHPSIRAEIAELQAQVESLRRVVKAMDRDLSDAIDGFYRRRQSDKMREIREEDEKTKPKIRTWKDLLNSPTLSGETGRQTDE